MSDDLVSKCCECQTTASVKVEWPSSMGPQVALLCDAHAGSLWQTYKHTPTGQAMTFSPTPYGKKIIE